MKKGKLREFSKVRIIKLYRMKSSRNKTNILAAQIMMTIIPEHQCILLSRLPICLRYFQ